MFTDNKIFILGMARSGYEAAKFLAKRNNKIIINDSKEEQDEEHVKELKELGVQVVLGEHPDDLFATDFDYLIKNPGIFDSHKYVQKAKKNNIPVINEVEMAYQLLPEDIKIIGITGTNGKTTTTTLLYEMIKASGQKVHLMGNIGFPVTSFIDLVRPGDIAVMEVSVQQLFNLNKFKTFISVLTNLSEAHLDMTGDYRTYLGLKKKIFNGHIKDNYAILNMDNADVLKLTEDINSTKKYFSSAKENIDGCYIKNNNIYYFDQKVIALDDIKIKGRHNYENAMAAIVAAKCVDVSNDKIVDVLTSFDGVEHRIELVQKKDGIEIYNDSKATNVKSTQIALSAFDKPTILLLGGLDRGHSFEGLTSYLDNVKQIVCYGQTKERIREYAERLKIPCEVVETLEEATKKAYSKALEGDVILLSPACASWDQYKDFEERGTLFKKYVDNLKKKGR